MPAVQVALDLLSIEDALTIAEEAVKGGATWLEAGTPLIKNHGMSAVAKLRAAFPSQTIVADMKTMDTGDLEVEMAAKNGADVVCILALADDFTIKRAVNSAKAHNVGIMADLIGTKDKIARAVELQTLGVDYVLLHTPLDIQKVKLQKVESSLGDLVEIKKKLDIPVAAAGGITLETIGFLKDAGAEVFVIGRTITKAKDVTLTTSKLCEAAGIEVEVKEAEKEPGIDEIIKTFERIPTPFVSDAMRRFGAMRGIKPITPGRRVAGKAFTVRTLGGDWGKAVKAVDMAEKGDILVIDAQSVPIAVWGELATLSAMKKGIKGVIIDGGIRDVDDIRALKFPAWARHTVPNAGEPHGHGSLGRRIACGGVPVSPGDMVIADEVGVVAVPKERTLEIMRKAVEVEKKEARYKEEIEKGKSLSEIFGL